MFDLFGRRWKREQAMIAEAFVRGAASVTEHQSDLAAMAAANEDDMADEILSAIELERIAQVEAHWSSLYEQQTRVMESLVAHLADSNETIVAARDFMTILAQRTHSGNPLFLINDSAAPGEADLLRHAIVTLQAHLEGTELPAMIAVDRVTH